MRIKTRIAAAANRALTRIPFPRCEMSECLKADGKTLDRAKALRAFAPSDDGESSFFTLASTDDDRVYFAAFVFLEQFHHAYETVISDPTTDAHEGVADINDEHLERRMEREKFVYATCDIRATAGGVRVRLWYDNPLGVVGQAEAEARCYTSTCAQLWLRIIDNVQWIRLEAAADILAEARERNRRAEIRHEYADCPKRVNGYCSPMSPDCPCFKAGGKCGYGEVTR